MTLNTAVKKIILQMSAKERELIAEKDSQPSWATDAQELYVNKDGSFTWLYASGCSCYTDTEREVYATIKELKVSLSEEWQNAVIKFAETGEVQDLYA